MEKQKLSAAATLPWYDDRVAAVRKNNNDPLTGTAGEPRQYGPREIYDYLERKVWKQEEAKKAASVMMYHCLRGIKSNAMFIGPSGCGKTYIWRCLKKIFPSRIEIADISNLTQDGWKGSLKWKDLLRSPIFRSGNHSILVLDEADKMLAPKFSYNENVSQNIQSEGLTLMEGAHVEVKDTSVIHEIDTAKISFILCGAFSNKAHDVAEKSGCSRIGFGAAREAVQPYTKPLKEADLIEFGIMPEFLGRIQRIVNLQLMTVDDYYRMTDNSLSLLAHIREQYQADIRLTPQKRQELAELASQTGLGVRGMENQIRQLIDDALFDDCERHHFEF
ncbi:MAG: AAA family ATPase [Oscillospiraceae bacterium]|nr:AAA family ATPase [Oscillospiraceae bacterium]